MRTVPATPRLSPSIPFLLRHRARRRGPCHPEFSVLPAPLPLPRGPRHRHRSGRRTTPAVISPCSGTLSRLISRSTPYLTFLQHQHLLSVFHLWPIPSPRAPRSVPGFAPARSRVRARLRPCALPGPCPASPPRSAVGACLRLGVLPGRRPAPSRRAPRSVPGFALTRLRASPQRSSRHNQPALCESVPVLAGSPSHRAGRRPPCQRPDRDV
jgi:hypothetical protein